MTRSEYVEIVNNIVAVEQERLAESLNAIFDKEGHNRAAFAHAFAKFVESQPAVTAHIVTEILEQSGLLSLDG